MDSSTQKILQQRDIGYYSQFHPQESSGVEGTSTRLMTEPRKVTKGPLWADKNLLFYLVSKEPEVLAKIYGDLTHTYQSLATVVTQEISIFPVLEYGSFDEVTEDEIIRLVTEEFRQFEEVSQIYYTNYLEGLRFTILLSPKIYRDQLMENLLNVEQKLRRGIKDKQRVPFDVDYLFNARAFNLGAVAKESHLIYGETGHNGRLSNSSKTSKS